MFQRSILQSSLVGFRQGCPNGQRDDDIIRILLADGGESRTPGLQMRKELLKTFGHDELDLGEFWGLRVLVVLLRVESEGGLWFYNAGQMVVYSTGGGAARHSPAKIRHRV